MVQLSVPCEILIEDVLKLFFIDFSSENLASNVFCDTFVEIKSFGVIGNIF